MHLTYFGDSYDIVKQALIGWLQPLGDWSVHPMFTGAVSATEAASFSRFLNATLLSTEVLDASTNRASYFEGCHQAGNLFLDPDTGLRLKRCSAGAAKYLFASELIPIVLSRPDALTMVFDQSLARGSEKNEVQQKLLCLAASGVHGFAYMSHACFLVLSSNQERLARAHETVLRLSRLPAARLIPVN